MAGTSTPPRSSSEGARAFCSPNLRLALASTVPLQSFSGNGVAAEFTLEEGQVQSFELQSLTTREQIGLTEDDSEQLFRDTIHYWRGWIAKCTYRGRWRETVHRSALVLKLLTFEPTGAIVAAPTCSLPESLGGSRNWDYRYTWIRDAAFTVYSLMRIGFTDEAAQFVAFLDARCHEMEPDGALQTVYGIDGRHVLTEETLDQWEGYKGSSPVRIGNDAYRQLQLDIYGELMDSMYLYNKYGTPISYDLWKYLRRLTDWVCKHWKEQDDAIWEVRGGPREFVYSKMMCWVAVDRALRLAAKRSFPADWNGWTSVRDEIYETIMQRGWNPQRGAFVQQFDGETPGADNLDASTLLMPLVFFVSPTDPRILRTIDAINRSPRDGGLVSDGLVFRYDVEKTPDGLKGTEGTFNICTFWLVEALTRAGYNDATILRRARNLFEQMLGYANHLGLFAEQIGHQGQALGNFPQALTHLALISAAFNLDRYLDGREKTPPVPVTVAVFSRLHLNQRQPALFGRTSASDGPGDSVQNQLQRRPHMRLEQMPAYGCAIPLGHHGVGVNHGLVFSQRLVLFRRDVADQRHEFHLLLHGYVNVGLVVQSVSMASTTSENPPIPVK